MGGKVYLVGCGPGAPDLLTLRAAGILREADVVLYDRLVDGQILEHARDSAEKIYVGKEPGEADKQEWINDLTYSKAKEGKVVVRLKNGNPVIFARGGEELQFLGERGIAVEIVPGLSSATSLPPLHGIPLTKRGISSSLSILTGVGEGGSEPSWENVGDTAVVLMTVSNLSRVVEKLTESKLEGETMGAVIASGTASDERVIVSQLSRIEEMVEFTDIEPPSILVAGDVVRKVLDIKGRSLAAFRPVQRRERAERLIEEAGGTPKIYGICEPRIPSDADLEKVFSEDWDVTIFMSSFGVEAVEGYLDLSKIKAIAVGNQTAESLRERGCEDVIVPKYQNSDGVRQLLEGRDWKALALRSAMADQELKGARNVVAYDMKPVNISENLDLYLSDSPDFTLITSAGMLKILLNAAEEGGRKKELIDCINDSFVLTLGGKCSSFAKSQGVKINYEFPKPDLESFFLTGN